MAEKKTPKKAVAKKAPVKKAATKTTASKAAAKKPVAKTTTSKAKAAVKTTTKAPTKKAVDKKVPEKAVVKKDAVKAPSKAAVASAKTVTKDTPKKAVKKSGGFLSGLALLCSLLALGLSGYMFYLLYMAGQNHKSENDSVQTAISDVAAINEKLSSSESVIEGLKKQITELTEQQQQMIDVEAVEALVNEQVEKRLETTASTASPIAPVKASEPGDTEKSSEVLPLKADKNMAIESSVKEAAEAGTEELVTETVNTGVWSWAQAKADIKEMFSDVITIKKTEN